MYKLDHHMLPILFETLFSKTSSVHSYNVRSSQNYRPVFAKSSIKRHSILCLGPRIYVIIPLNYTNKPNLYAFKRLYKQLIIEVPLCVFNLMCSIPHTNIYFTH